MASLLASLFLPSLLCVIGTHASTTDYRVRYPGLPFGKDNTPKNAVVIASSVSMFHNRSARQTIPEWQFDDSFEFLFPWRINDQNIVRNAMLGAVDLMSTTMRVLGGIAGDTLPHGEDDTSFQRYFNPGDLPKFGGVVQRVLAMLGTPGTHGVRQCLRVSKLQLVYGDGPAFDPDLPNRQCEPRIGSSTYAYYSAYMDQNGLIRSYVSFCQLFFDQAKLHMPSSDLNMPYVDPTKFVAWIDDGGRYGLPDTESSASILMHEFFHWTDITEAIIPTQIQDLIIQRPDDPNEKPKAYRSFLAMKVKDPAWRAPQGPLYNADSYVYTILEIFYRYRYGRQPWQDSPDPQGDPKSPNVPPSGPSKP